MHPNSKFHVLLDAHMLGEQEGGNETYIAGLIKGLQETTNTDPNTISVLVNPHYRIIQKSQSSPELNTVHFRQLSTDNSIKRIFYAIPRLCSETNADLVHVTYNASPLIKCPVLVSVHDVIFRIYPEFFAPRVRLLLNTLLPLTMMKARRIITISETSKTDIERFYPFTKGKIHVTPVAPGTIINSLPDHRAVDEYCKGQDFVLSVGTIQPRKNIERLIEAYVEARSSGAITAKLLIAGRSAWQHSDIHRRATESTYGKDIIFTGYVSNEVLAALYERCLVFVYPSLYEGFGLPVLEAMACGAPVITSDRSSLPEVAGNAAVLVDPFSIEDIRTAIQNVVSNAAFREELRKKGKERADNFSWKRTASMTLDLYRQVVAENG